MKKFDPLIEQYNEKKLDPLIEQYNEKQLIQ